MTTEPAPTGVPGAAGTVVPPAGTVPGGGPAGGGLAGSGGAAVGAVPGASAVGVPEAPTAPEAAGAGAKVAAVRPIDLLHGVEMAVTVELGRTRVLVRDLLGLRAGSIVELDRQAGGPVDVVVNGTLLARGEVVVIDDELGVRITEVVGREDDL
jgi:flagellar motor switch protein FliN/FliY